MNPEVSIIIVSMNNVSCLFPCLDSIRHQTKVSYETLVVAYMFSEDNLRLLAEKYPWVTIIKSNELRGFAENNNLALQQANGKYCFIVNDDTLMNMPVIDMLVDDISKVPASTAAISPKIVFPNGKVQTCGRAPWTPLKYLKHYLHLVDETKPNKWAMQNGLFMTYTLNGACFLAKTDIFKKSGWFDETYTFTPEDIALGTLFSKSGHPVYTDADVEITHIANATASRIEAAIKPTRVRGSLIFYSSLGRIKPNQGTADCNPIIYTLMGLFLWSFEALRGIKYLFCDCSDSTPASRHNKIMRDSAANVRKSIFTKKTTKEIFTEYYQQVTGKTISCE